MQGTHLLSATRGSEKGRRDSIAQGPTTFNFVLSLWHFAFFCAIIRWFYLIMYRKKENRLEQDAELPEGLQARGCACSPFQDAGSYVRPVRAAGDGGHREHRHCRPRFSLYPCAVRAFAAAGFHRPCLQPDGAVFFRKGGGGLFHSPAPCPVCAYPDPELYRDGHAGHQHPHYPHDQRHESGAERPEPVFAPVPAQPVRGHRCHGHGLYGQRPGRADLCCHHPAAERGGVQHHGSHAAPV